MNGVPTFKLPLAQPSFSGGTPSTSKDLEVSRKFQREFFQKLADVFPHWHNGYITERDRYMTYQLQTFVEELSRRKFAQWKANKRTHETVLFYE